MRYHRVDRRHDLSALLAGRAHFRNTTGSLYGCSADQHRRECWDPCGWLSGEDRDRFDADRDRMDYVVVSYATPIAWATPEGWYVVGERFSVTTSRHQSQVRRGLAGIPVEVAA